MAFIIALALRVWVDWVIAPGFPLVTFIPAVMISAFLAGSRAGLLCASLCFFALWYWFLGEPGSFAINYRTSVALIFFIIIVAINIGITEYASRSVDRLINQQAQIQTILETVPLGLVMAEFPKGKIVQTNKCFDEEFGKIIKCSPGGDILEEWMAFNEDGTAVGRDEFPLAAMMLRGEDHPSIEVQYERQDGYRAWVRILGRPVRGKEGRLTGGVVALIDIDEQRNAKLALEDALNAKEILLYEVNHRVKNSLHLVNSFLLFEELRTQNKEAQAAVMAARNKVDLIARVHQNLYQSSGHDVVDIKTSIEEIVIDLISSAGRDDVELQLNFIGDHRVDIRIASPLVLIINEIVTNSLKYGLSSKEPKLRVSTINQSSGIILTIADNGIGISPASTDKKTGFGTRIIEGLASQIRGSISFESDSNGTTVVISIPSHSC